MLQSFLKNHDIETREDLIPLVQAVANVPWGEARSFEDVLEKNMGTCTGKHVLLGACFDHLGIEYRPVVCTFQWAKQGIVFPDHLQNILEKYSWNHGHNFVQIKHENDWIDVDITWDTLLMDYNFPVFPAEWDGQTPFIGLQSMEERWDGVSIKDKKADLINALSDEQRAAREEFLEGFIEWIDDLRK